MLLTDQFRKFVSVQLTHPYTRVVVVRGILVELPFAHLFLSGDMGSRRCILKHRTTASEVEFYIFFSFPYAFISEVEFYVTFLFPFLSWVSSSLLSSHNLLRQIITPNSLGNLDLETDLGPLLLHRQVVPFLGRAEAALVRQAELVQALGAVLSGLLEPLDHLVLVVKLGLLAGHDAQNDDLVLGQVAEGGEVA